MFLIIFGKSFWGTYIQKRQDVSKDVSKDESIDEENNTIRKKENNRKRELVGNDNTNIELTCIRDG